MHPQAANGSPWGLLLPIVIGAGVIILRNSRARRLRIEAMWVMPVIIVAVIGFALYAESLQGGLALTPVGVALDVAALAIGALLGWWRARFTNITIDPATHELTSRASPIGMVVILGILVLRTGIRTYTAENAGALGQWGPPVADALLVMSVGLVCAQRLEIFTRASRLLAEHRTSSSGPG